MNDDDEHAHGIRQPGWGHPIMLLAVAVLVVFWALVAWALWMWLS